MSRPIHPKFAVQCVLSSSVLGWADEGRIFNACVDGPLQTSHHRLMDDDYLSVTMRIPNEARPLKAGLAKVLWVQGERFAVELLLMDADEFLRFKGLLNAHLPIQLALQPSRAELTITAAE